MTSFRFGSWRILQYSDGLVPVPKGTFDLPDGEKTDLFWPLSVFLLLQGKRKILIDTGCGDFLGPSCGKFFAFLLKSGISPDDITDVLLTHAHPDHVGGLSSRGEALFTSAEIYLADRESEWLKCLETAPKISSFERQIIDTANSSLEPYLKTKRVRIFKPGRQDLFGARTMLLTGHTPGMSGLLLKQGNESLLFCGDLFNDLRQVSTVELTANFDVTPREAVQTRQSVLAAAAEGVYCLLAAHQPFFGPMRVHRQGASFYVASAK